MSYEVPVSFAQKFRDDFIMLSQQRDSRLIGTVRRDPDNLDGKFGYFERIGATDAQEVTERHGDTPLISTPHSRRRITLRDFDWADLIDKRDARRMIASGVLPSRYAMNAIWAMNRKKDDRIIAAATGDAYSIDEDDAASTVALPSGQKIAHGSAGLTVAKVLSAKELLDAAEVDEEEPRFAVASSKQFTNLLGTTEVTSVDYNSVKTLVEGKIDTWMGFKWIRSERLGTDSNGNRQALFYAMSGIGVAVGQDVETDVRRRPDKRNAMQVYVDMSIDATRIEDEKVVECACVES